MHMGSRKSFLIACAICAVALLGAPRIAHAQILELEMSVESNIRLNSSTSGGRSILTDQYTINQFAATTGGFSSIPRSTTITDYYVSLYNYDNIGFYCAKPVYNYLAGSSINLSTYPQIAYIFDCWNLDLTNHAVKTFAPRNIDYFFLPFYGDQVANHSTASYGHVSQTVNYWYYLPHGSDRSVATNWLPITSGSDGYFHINTSIDAFACILSGNVTLQDSPVLFSQMDYRSLYFGTPNLPHIYIDFPELSDVATSSDIASAASSINASIVTSTSTLTSSISAQSTAINQNIDHEVQSQTSTMMDTTGASSVFSDQLADAQDSLTQGVFGQIGDLESSVLSWSSSTTRNNGVYFPGISVLGYELAAPRTVYIWVNGLQDFQEPVRAATTFILFVLWLRGLYWIFYHQILGIDVNALGNAYKDD